MASAVSADQMSEFVYPLLRRLSTGDWFTSRTSACGVYAVSYPSLSAGQQAEMRGMYTTLCQDDTPMVRRAAAKNYKDFCVTIDKEDLKNEMIPVFVTLAQDEQDSVRLLAVENCVALASVLTLAENNTYVLQTVKVCFFFVLFFFFLFFFFFFFVGFFFFLKKG